MSIAVIVPDRDITTFIKALSAHTNDEIVIGLEGVKREAVDVAVLWNHPAGTISSLPNLKLISSFGAGVEHILNDPDYRPSIPLTRIVDRDLSDSMARYVIAAVSMFQYGLCASVASDAMQLKPHYEPNLTIGILGLGELGQASAKRLYGLGYKVLGLSRSEKTIEGVKSFTSDRLDEFLTDTNILVCMLPMTSQTEDIIDIDLLCQLKKPSFFINVGRGKQVAEQDLLRSVQQGVIEGACLDVVRNEPITSDHPFVKEPRIVITPHIASVTNQENAAFIIADNIQRLRNGEELKYRVDASSGY